LDAAKILTECGASEKWLEIAGSLPDTLKENGRIRLYNAVAHMNCGEMDAAKQIVNESFSMSDIKEGELSLSAVWADLYADEKPLPAHLNFRMHEK